MPTLLQAEGAEAVQGALDLLGTGGDRWIRDHAFEPDPFRGGFDYCVIGALIAAASTKEVYETAYQAVKEAVGGNIARWNNRDTTTFVDVQLTLRRAANNLREGL